MIISVAITTALFELRAEKRSDNPRTGFNGQEPPNADPTELRSRAVRVLSWKPQRGRSPGERHETHLLPIQMPWAASGQNLTLGIRS